MKSALKALVCSVMASFAFLPDPHPERYSDNTNLVGAIFAMVWVGYWTYRSVRYLQET